MAIDDHRAVLRARTYTQTAEEPLRGIGERIAGKNIPELTPNSLGGLVELIGIEPTTSSLRSTKSGLSFNRLEGNDAANPGTADQRLSDPRGQIAGNGSGAPITPETRW